MTENSRKETDIFNLLKQATQKEKRKKKSELLDSLGVLEYFDQGTITINKKTCRGVECKLCIKACPTSALFWKSGEIGITEPVCVYCGACVLSCIVDDCIRITRKRSSGEAESFGTAKQFMEIQNRINAAKRLKKIDEVKDLLPSKESFKRKRQKPK